MFSRHFSAVIVLICSAFCLNAQDNYGSEANILYNRERMAIINLNTNGIGVGYRQSKIKDAFKASFFQVDFSTYWDIKEQKVAGLINGFRPFKYGKINEIFFLKGGYGNIYKLTRKPDWGGVELQLAYSFGANVCFAMPIYLYVLYPGDDFAIAERYDPAGEHSAVTILGKGPYFGGFLETKVYPGLHGNIGLYLEYGQYNNTVKAIEVGGAINIFPIGVPVMAYNDPKNVFFSFYINVIFGKRYN